MLLLAVLFAAPAHGLEPASASAQPTAAQASSESAPRSCFDRVWHDAHDAPWYLDAQGRPVVPEVRHDWLVIRLADPTATTPAQTRETAAASPPADSGKTTFESRYGTFFDYRLALPAAPDAELYRVRPALPYGAFDALLKRLRDDRTVSYVLPVWQVAGRLQAPMNQVEVTWKTITPPQQRQQLRRSVGATPLETAKQDAQRVEIDPCRRLTWQAAVLLAEDLRVRRAVPRLLPIEPPVAVRFELAGNGALSGTPLPFRLEIRFGDNIRIVSATLADLDLRPTGIFQNLYAITFDQPISAIDTRRSPIVVTGHLAIYATGEHLLPEVPVYYTDLAAENTSIATVKAPPTPVRIGALVPEKTPDYRLKAAQPGTIPPLPAPDMAGRRWLGTLSAAAGLLLLGLAAVVWKRLRGDRRRTDDGARQRREQSREILTAWLQRNPAEMQAGEITAFGAALRDYLAENAGLATNSRGGGHAVFLGKLAERLPAGVLPQAETLLRRIDHLLAGGEGTVRELFAQTATLLDRLDAMRAGQED